MSLMRGHHGMQPTLVLRRGHHGVQPMLVLRRGHHGVQPMLVLRRGPQKVQVARYNLKKEKGNQYFIFDYTESLGKPPIVSRL